jgi:prepilin-type N-terminal cleavage/methylation domain-containing protein/prepilin-type processing-associated H-X9-DG protein
VGRGFTLVELLVVISIMAALMGLLLPSLSRARKQAKGTLCMTRLRTLGQGLTMYVLNNGDVFVPGRLPKVDDEHWQEEIAGGLKYRPTFLAMMGSNVGIPAFDDPQPTKRTVDRFGEAGDRQNYSNKTYVCPSVPTWTDERNGCYGYNYQFLGNSRLFDGDNPQSFKNWPVQFTRVRSPASCVAVADSMGTAASFREHDRLPYDNNSREAAGYGNEGFNLDPPRVDPINGEMANFDKSPQSRSALHPRHLNKGNVLWVDGHCSPETLQGLGYQVLEDGVIGFEGNNRFFTIDGTDRAWTPGLQFRRR